MRVLLKPQLKYSILVQKLSPVWELVKYQTDFEESAFQVHLSS